MYSSLFVLTHSVFWMQMLQQLLCFIRIVVPVQQSVSVESRWMKPEKCSMLLLWRHSTSLGMPLATNRCTYAVARKKGPYTHRTSSACNVIGSLTTGRRQSSIVSVVPAKDRYHSSNTQCTHPTLSHHTSPADSQLQMQQLATPTLSPPPGICGIRVSAAVVGNNS